MSIRLRFRSYIAALGPSSADIEVRRNRKIRDKSKRSDRGHGRFKTAGG